MPSVAIGIALTWLVAFVLALVGGYALAWPLALFLGGDPVIGWGVGFFGVGAFGAAWSLRTSRALWRDHVRRSDTFRAPWPRTAARDGLVASGLIDRRGQPGPGSADAGDLVARLAAGDCYERHIASRARHRWYLTVDGPEGSSASILDEARTVFARVEVGAAPARVELEAGSWRIELARAADRGGGADDVRGWWIRERGIEG